MSQTKWVREDIWVEGKSKGKKPGKAIEGLEYWRN